MAWSEMSYNHERPYWRSRLEEEYEEDALEEINKNLDNNDKYDEYDEFTEEKNWH